MKMRARVVMVVLFVVACKRHQEEDAITFPPPPDPPPASSATIATTNTNTAPSASSDAPIAMLGVIGDGGMPWGREGALDASDLGSAGGSGEGIGLGNIGTIGHASTHTQGSSRLRQGTTMVNGRLPPEVIQRIVRQNFGRFRLCYEQGLKRDPTISGTVATKFVIDRSGNVINVARDATTTLADAGVVSCITRAFTNLTFPQPEGGIVTVVYPIIFDPS